jgi:hypothetical protein
MLLADFCNRLTTRAPVDHLIPERVTFVSPTAAAAEREPVGDCGASPPCGDPAPGGARLTALAPASVHFDHFSSRSAVAGREWRRGNRSRDTTSPRRYRPRATLANDL